MQNIFSIYFFGQTDFLQKFPEWFQNSTSTPIIQQIYLFSLLCSYQKECCDSPLMQSFLRHLGVSQGFVFGGLTAFLNPCHTFGMFLLPSCHTFQTSVTRISVEVFTVIRYLISNVNQNFAIEHRLNAGFKMNTGFAGFFTIFNFAIWSKWTQVSKQF